MSIDATTPPATKTVRGSTVYVRRFRVEVLEGADRGASMVSSDDELAIGTAEGVHLRLSDPAICVRFTRSLSIPLPRRGRGRYQDGGPAGDAHQ